MQLTGAGNLLSVSGLSSGQPERLVGQTIAKITLDKLLATSNFSWVYKGTRMLGNVKQQVVMKVLLNQMGLRIDNTHFEREWSALASLSHPNISTLIDIGKTNDGLHYIIMEHIEGLPIDKYCNRKRLSAKRRIKLVISVLKALKFTHSRLIVHGDLKPNNILVTSDGIIKLVDFGISALLSDNSDSVSANKFFTPHFAAPEQKSGQSLSVQTDVYQCGVLLDLLVCSGLLNASQINGQTGKPHYPSIAIKRTAIRQDTSIRQVKKVCQSTLRLIVAKSTHEDVEKRYESVEQLIGDLEKYVDLRPTSVDTQRWLTPVRFFQRHVMVSSITLVSTMLFSIAILSFQLRLIQSNKILISKTTELESVAQFLSDTVGLAGKKLDTSNELTIADLIDDATTQLHARANLSEDVKKDLAITLSRAYAQLQQYHKSLDALRPIISTISLDSQSSQLDLRIGLRAAEAFYDVGDLASAEKLVTSLSPVVTNSSVLKLSPVVRASYFKLRAELFRKSGNFGEAIEAIHLAEAELYQSNDLKLKRMLYNLKGGVYLNIGEYREAIKAFEDGLSLSGQIHGNSSPFTDIVISGNLAILYNIIKEHDIALTIIEKQLEIAKSKYPSRHSQIASMLNTRGMIHLDAGDYLNAESDFEESIAIYTTTYGEDFIKLVSPLDNMSRLLASLNRCQESRSFYERVTRLSPEDSLRPNFSCSSLSSREQKVH
ncbi:serine/threonine-protein kinase [Alteromonas oceanisediminis]|uniref:serine/threonine-protein kinase n=1 Tax=Alteromonas oceanisediminis TaxID=2836180 RepID=UPI001BD9FB6B|nr:serine/threonine-protein kinase [Alteromonas oceanisediminis]MBT0587059.1 serine/threonine-protein kinase [Alteromonas oceanisediminis]